MRQRPSVHDLHRLTGKRKLIELHVDNAHEAAAGEEAGIDMLSCAFDRAFEEFSRLVGRG